MAATVIGGTKVKQAKVKDVKLDIAGPKQSYGRSGQFGYNITKLPSTYDRAALIVELDDGQYGAWFSLRPNDAPKNVISLVQTSLAGVKAQ